MNSHESKIAALETLVNDQTKLIDDQKKLIETMAEKQVALETALNESKVAFEKSLDDNKVLEGTVGDIQVNLSNMAVEQVDLGGIEINKAWPHFLFINSVLL